MRSNSAAIRRTSVENADISRLLADIEHFLPEHLGDVDRSSMPKAAARGLVVCISDLHSHIPVQRNTARIISHLGSLYGFRLLCVEGASGAGDVSLLWSLPIRRRFAFCDFLFGRGYLTGSEFAAVKYPQLGLALWGVDDPSLYRVQWHACKSNFAVRSGIKLALFDSRRTLRRLYSPLISRNLLKLIQLRWPRADSGYSINNFTDCVNFLFEVAQRNDLTLPADLWAKIPAVRKEGREQRAKRQSDKRDLQAWIDSRFQPIAQLLAPFDSAIKENLGDAHWYKAFYNQLSPYAQRLARMHSVESALRPLPKPTQNRILEAYERFTDQFSAMPDNLRRVYDADAPPLSFTLAPTDVDRLWKIVSKALCVTEMDWIARRLEKRYSLALDFLGLEMSPSESLGFMAPDRDDGDYHPEYHRVPTDANSARSVVVAHGLTAQDQLCEETERDIVRLHELAQSAGGAHSVPRDLVVAIHAFWDASETYYSVARQRSFAMARNIALEMTRRQVDRAIAVSGGFHSHDMSEWLTREASMGTAIIHPSHGDSLYASAGASYRYNRRLVEE